MSGKLPTPPATYHGKNHSGPYEHCWRCQRNKARCRSKRVYSSREEATEAVREINHGNAFVEPVTRYRCRWCLLWHISRATRKIQVKRSERDRRKWLIAARSEALGQASGWQR